MLLLELEQEASLNFIGQVKIGAKVLYKSACFFKEKSQIFEFQVHQSNL